MYELMEARQVVKLMHLTRVAGGSQVQFVVLAVFSSPQGLEEWLESPYLGSLNNF